ncbi:hypothetical protein MWN33_12440 [Starkeya koreensis]|uniref:Beta-barrel assembly machine subunit BamF n=1 Tax=Ancylobacter koreensis TaxID=266121 RepID=A0ABT0DNH9_9HYPH|nr:hypothetical protein [Ancylobacter koreensis]MCK0208838.1 hypothetical protein [Ancylobacter koreensis]
MLALLLAGCAASGGPSGIVTGEALDAAVAEGESPAAPATSSVETAPLASQPVSHTAQTANVASPTPPTDSAPATASSTGRRSDATSRAAPAPKGRQKEAEKTYPSFGAPATVGDRPTLTTDEAAKLQQNLETLAREREAKTVRELEQDQ